jgi:hypothetical protein
MSSEYNCGMSTDPRRIVDDLEADIVNEEGALNSAGDPPTPAAEDASAATPGVEPTD